MVLRHETENGANLMAYIVRAKHLNTSSHEMREDWSMVQPESHYDGEY